ncbi:unnamed protein product [Lymnaea stagnalis]|uniref:Uncharacterized protein n=1 Tax=Lymnaea stagnalis TaxID=6523 RepID=A0AAV2H6S1_LYMST
MIQPDILPGTCGRPTAYGGYCNRKSKDGRPCSSHRPQRVGARSSSVTDRRRAAETTLTRRASSDTRRSTTRRTLDLTVTPTQHAAAVMYPSQPTSRIWRFAIPSSQNKQPWLVGRKWRLFLLYLMAFFIGALFIMGI